MTRRRLSDEEAALWQGVIRSISPLRRAPKRRSEPVTPETERSAAKSRPIPPLKSAGKPAPAAPPASSKPVAPPPLAPLGRKLKQRIARGSRDIDGRLDLHGFTQAEAYDALLHFLRGRQASGAKLVLVITGKGARGGDAHGERGVLKRMVPLWLRLPEFRSFVIGFESAAIGHGGEGALYVSLRKGRSPA
jgi:DNA-nicking Smr family endonuclease